MPMIHLAMAILAELAAGPQTGGMSLPRLAKRLGLSVSAVLRQLSLMGDAGDRWASRTRLGPRRADGGAVVIHLTEAGRRAAAALDAAPDDGQLEDGERSDDH